MDIIQINPYRLLGIYSNSSTKERIANNNRLKAFLKVGKTISFQLDLPQLLPAINRTTDAVAKAEAKLTLPNEQLRYAQFWFIKITPMDDIAMNHLFAGNIENAISIWEKKENVSSLQNRIVCALIQSKYNEALIYAEKLYSAHSTDFVNVVLGENHTASTEELGYCFLDEFYSAIGVQVFSYSLCDNWKQYLKNKSITPIIETLQSAIDTAKSSKGKGIKARFIAGINLMNDTKSSLSQLRSLLTESNLQYQMIADKLGLEILQCGIDYYNDSEALDAASKAMKLHAYALSIVVGKMAKDRCKENMDILQKIIDELPPVEVFAENRAVNKLVEEFYNENYHFNGAKNFLFGCEPYLISIKSKLGANNQFYIEISTSIANILLSFVIKKYNEQVNETLASNFEINKENTLRELMLMLRPSWNIILNIEELNTSNDFTNKRFKPNKKNIEKFIAQLDNHFPYNGYKFDISENPIDRLGLGNRLEDLGGKPTFRSRSHPYATLTENFMSGYRMEEFINLKIEEDYFNECKEDFQRKKCYANSYKHYLEKFPNGKFVEQVKQFESTSQHEYELYNEHKKNIAGCKMYMKTYPNGWFINDIKNDFDRLLFEYYKSIKKLKNYIREYPNGKHVSEATDIIKKEHKVILMWILGILIPSIIIAVFITLEWSIILAIIIAVLVLLSIISYSLDDENKK
ncbi:hypothetical protein [Odoribacter lunatus]|uniref:hypothetical protein n=1 Tax=Odoribacter lunatus TaxID=2941335 RepID=UPI00203A3946|nr:hypothetical protein [Odoribacter lunatus]